MDEREYLDDIDEDFNSDIVELYGLFKEMDKGNIYLSNPRELSKIEIAEEIIRKVVNSDELKITREINEPSITTGGIDVEGKTIKISDPKLFIEILRLADNIDFYPKTNGNVCMGVTFRGLAVRIGRVE